MQINIDILVSIISLIGSVSLDTPDQYIQSANLCFHGSQLLYLSMNSLWLIEVTYTGKFCPPPRPPFLTISPWLTDTLVPVAIPLASQEANLMCIYVSYHPSEIRLRLVSTSDHILSLLLASMQSHFSHSSSASINKWKKTLPQTLSSKYLREVVLRSKLCRCNSRDASGMKFTSCYKSWTIERYRKHANYKDNGVEMTESLKRENYKFRYVNQYFKVKKINSKSLVGSI